MKERQNRSAIEAERHLHKVNEFPVGFMLRRRGVIEDVLIAGYLILGHHTKRY